MTEIIPANPFLLKPGSIVNINKDAKARIERIGKEILTLKIIGRKSFKKESIGNIVTIINRKFIIISAGRTAMFKLLNEPTEG